MGYSNEVTQTDPSPTAISPPGPGIPAAIVATTLFVFESTREMVPSPWLIVQTEPSPTARNRGRGPTVMTSSTTWLCGLTRVSTPFSVPVTHTAPSPKATANEPGAT